MLDPTHLPPGGGGGGVSRSDPTHPPPRGGGGPMYPLPPLRKSRSPAVRVNCAIKLACGVAVKTSSTNMIAISALLAHDHDLMISRSAAAPNNKLRQALRSATNCSAGVQSMATSCRPMRGRSDGIKHVVPPAYSTARNLRRTGDRRGIECVATERRQVLSKYESNMSHQTSLCHGGTNLARRI